MKEAILLAGGIGKGLDPLTQTRHKVLVPLINRTLLEHHIATLTQLGFNRLIVVVNYLRKQVIDEITRLSKYYSFSYKIVDQGKPLGTGHALLKAIDHVSNDFLLIYGDVFVRREDVEKVLRASGHAIAGFRVKDPSNYGVLVTSDGFLKSIVEKPLNPPGNLVNAGVYKLSKDISRYLEKLNLSPRNEYELTDAINLYATNNKVKVIEIGLWIDIGRPWKLLEVNKLLLGNYKEQHIRGNVESNAKLKGPLIVEEGADILSGSYIIGPVFIDKDVVIGPNAYIRPYSVILKGSKIGFNVEVKESIVMEGAHIAHQSYVGDSIVGEGTNLGAGTLLANLRFDNLPVPFRVKGRRVSSGRRKLGAIIGGWVKTGVNVSTYPGVKIGSYSWINPGVIVKNDIPPCVHLIESGKFRPLKGKCPIDLNIWL